MNRISLCGTQNSGKTTLINELSKLSEFKDYKFFTEKTKYLKENLGVKLNEDSELISQYIFLGQRAQELFNDKIFCDRSVYDVCAYTFSSKSIPFKDIKIFVEGCVPLMNQYDVIFYVDPTGIEIEDNNVRSIDPIYREKIDYTIKELLKEYPPIRLYNISGTIEQRISQVKEAIFS